MRRHIARVFYAAAAAGIALATVSLPAAGAVATNTTATPAIGPPAYNFANAGYQAGGGRWFRFVSATLIVPARTLPADTGGNAFIALTSQHGPLTDITVMPGGGDGTVVWTDHSAPHTIRSGTFAVSPHIGDQLVISIYFDQHGHDFFTATDLTQHTTQTVRAHTGSPVYDNAVLAGNVLGTTKVPQPVRPMWQFTSSHITTYTGRHGTIVGPWITTELIVTSNGHSSGTVAASPTWLANGGQDFNVWLPFIPVWTNAQAGYETGGGRQVRFLSTRITVPARQPGSIAHGGAGITGWIALRAAAEQARITVIPGGGSGSVTYHADTASRSAKGAFRMSPKVGDTLAISIYYDRHNHDSFTATDITQGTAAQTARLRVGRQAYFSAVLLGSIENNAVTSPAADTRLWTFSGIRVTSYSGARGTVLGPWTAAQFIDTTDGTAYGSLVMNAPALRNGGQRFSIWLRD